MIKKEFSEKPKMVFHPGIASDQKREYFWEYHIQFRDCTKPGESQNHCAGAGANEKPPFRLHPALKN